MSEELVLTPGGYRPKSLVNHVEPGHHIDGKGGALRKLDAKGAVLHDFGPVIERHVHTPLMPFNVSHLHVAQAAGPVPSFGTGWIVFAGWPNATGHPITSFSTTWTVPSAPATSSGQTIFLFNGIQNSSMIYQPVLQWGVSAAGGGAHWSVACWYADGQGGVSFHTNLVNVNPGDVLVGVMTQTGLSGSNHNYSAHFQGIANTTLPITNVQELTWANETLEAYGITRCSDYPNADMTAMRAISIMTGTTHPTFAWSPQHPVTDCGQSVTVVSNSSTNGEVDLHYRAGNPFPNWQELDNNPATVDIVASGGHLYQRHHNGKIWIYTGTPHTGWLELDNNPATVQIAADGGALYQRHNTGRIWVYTGTPHTGWQELDNNPATVDIVASGGHLYQRHNNGKIWIYTGTPHTGWLELDNNPATVQIAADGSALYQRHNTGRIWVYTGTPHTGWQELDNNPATVDIVASGGHLYQRHNNGKIWIYTGTPHTGWLELDNNPATVQIAADGSALYQRHNTGRIWVYTGTPHTGWRQLDGNAATVQIAAGGGRLYQRHNTGRIWVYTG